jgi:GTP-binding protein EngB required for normal cell division
LFSPSAGRQERQAIVRGVTLFRALLAALLSIGFALALLGLFYATDLAFSVWQRLAEAPIVLVGVYVALVALLAAGVGYVLWRLLRPRPAKKPSKRSDRAPSPPSRAELHARMAKAEAQGADIGSVRAELGRLAEHEARLSIALFGEVGSGKSSLVQTLLPGCRVDIDPRAGTTRSVTRYRWHAPNGEEVVLIDLPGCNDPARDLDPVAREEALRAHAVVYLTDSDLTRAQHRELAALLTLGKPVIVAINKMDWYTERDRDTLRARIAERVPPRCEVVTLSAGGRREVVRTRANGQEVVSVEPVPPNVAELLAALARTLGEDRTALLRGRETAVLGLAAHKLDVSLAAHRGTRAEEIVRDYARQAVVGALVAVTPGTDLVIQGYLAVGMVRSLCELYEVSGPQVDMTRLLRLATKRARKALPMVLAVAGNAFKAFPGLGTVAGGALHAVGYGLIFESLGHAVAEGLAREGDLGEQATLQRFEEDLSGDLGTRAERLVRLALAPGKGHRSEP